MADEEQEVAIEVEFIYDQESDNWGFRVPSLHVTGGAKTQAEAVEMAKEAILYALEGPESTNDATKRGYFAARISAPKHLVPA
jgi:predicted RNase H-like HicB family nuclease